MKEEYRHYNETSECKNAYEFEKLFEPNKIVVCYPPCFYAGNPNTSNIAILGLNPGYKEKDNRTGYNSNKVEYRIFESKKKNGYPYAQWEDTYTNFFNHFKSSTDLRLKSRYYSRISILIAGIIGKSQEQFPIYLSRKKRETGNDERYSLLQEHIVNMDLIPYHSASIRFPSSLNEEQEKFLKPYLDNLRKLIKSNVKLILLNGKIWGLDSLGWRKEQGDPCITTVKKNSTFNVFPGEWFGKKAVHIPRFLTGKEGLTNQELYKIGSEIREKLSLKSAGPSYH